jgi:hypothetical protein
VLERVAAELATLALRSSQTNQQLMATVIRTSRP